ncbi:sigma factor, partial [Saccharothrix sp. NPDC042600]|uniref:sigma factor n=1 Tax=Saccharothrix sp. NPDC042600 TaxID=3154492 RepID=UPI00341164A9
MAELHRRERPGLLRLAALLLGDRAQAEDVVQDAFLNTHRKRATLDPTTAAGHLRVAVVNGARTAHRRGRLTWRHHRTASPDTPGRHRHHRGRHRHHRGRHRHHRGRHRHHRGRH